MKFFHFSEFHRSRGSASLEESRPRLSASYRRERQSLPKSSSKKPRQRSYRDESDEPAFPRVAARSVEYDSRSREEEASSIQAKSREVPRIVWQDSYGREVDSPDEEDARSTYSKEELAGEISAEKHILENLDQFDY